MKISRHVSNFAQLTDERDKSSMICSWEFNRKEKSDSWKEFLTCSLLTVHCV